MFFAASNGASTSGARAGAEAAAQVGLLDERAEGVDERASVVDGHDQAGLAVADDLGDAGDGGRHQRQFGGAGLGQHHREAVAPGRQAEDVGAGGRARSARGLFGVMVRGAR